MTHPKATLRCPCEESNCRVVLEYRSPPNGETRFDLPGDAYHRVYERCEICGHFFARHELDLASLYDGEYLDATYGDANGMARRLEKVLSLPPDQSDNAGRVAAISRFVNRHFGDDCQNWRLLDIGAGIGVFPISMIREGWTVTAMEPDGRAAEHLRSVARVNTLTGDLRSYGVDEIGRFELISFNKVLEHVIDPTELLAKSREFLAPRGLVYVELPDVAAAAAGPEREEFFIEHHHVFSPASVDMMAERAALKTVCSERIREPSGKYTLRTFLTTGDEQG